MIIIHAISLFVFLFCLSPVLREILHEECTADIVCTLLWIVATIVLIEMWRMGL